MVVVGASGDLARKKIFPALFALYHEGMLPEVGPRPAVPLPVRPIIIIRASCCAATQPAEAAHPAHSAAAAAAAAVAPPNLAASTKVSILTSSPAAAQRLPAQRRLQAAPAQPAAVNCTHSAVAVPSCCCR